MSEEAICPNADVAVKWYCFDGFLPVEELDLYRELRGRMVYPKTRSIIVRS